MTFCDITSYCNNNYCNYDTSPHDLLDFDYTSSHDVLQLDYTSLSDILEFEHTS